MFRDKVLIFKLFLNIVQAFFLSQVFPGTCLYAAAGSRETGLQAFYERPPERNVRIAESVEMQFCRIPGGEFLWDSPENDGTGQSEQQKVSIAHGFWLGKYEVTQKQWQALMGTNPSAFKGENRPVELVSWHDCLEFIDKLNRRTGKKFRLPRESEWELACRAGTDTGYYWGNSIAEEGDYCWSGLNSKGQTHCVGEKKPNRWGLYDMNGNVWEWCQESSGWDNYIDLPRGRWYVARGGSWFTFGESCGSSIRTYNSPDSRFDDFGFRLACDEL
ncbi:MAG: formylglycine-generating enzyme family protein [Candidatus Wallbacteria bacterium]|nr:formylglycine-generating enzyme family protein [Candidatus Wallbacteria bacterium]